jgi:membrane protein implicated in regulation of membrane protease activity
MEVWAIWICLGIILILAEFLLPGAVIVFPGMAAVLVGLAIFFQWIDGSVKALTIWFVLSVFLMIFLRSFFIKYFEGDSHHSEVDELQELVGVLVEVSEDILPFKEGRIKFRDSSWVARSDQELRVGEKAIILKREGNTFVIKSV